MNVGVPVFLVVSLRMTSAASAATASFPVNDSFVTGFGGGAATVAPGDADPDAVAPGGAALGDTALGDTALGEAMPEDPALGDADAVAPGDGSAMPGDASPVTGMTS